jgi:hypothetical protein
MQIDITSVTPARVLSTEDLIKDLKEVVSSQNPAFSGQSALKETELAVLAN